MYRVTGDLYGALKTERDKRARSYIVKCDITILSHPTYIYLTKLIILFPE